jgi:hypothetical protein
MNSKIFFSFIYSSYQEKSLERYLNHFQIKDKVYLFRYFNKYDKSYLIKKPLKKNVKKKYFFNKLIFFSLVIYYLILNFFNKKKFIFGNANSRSMRLFAKFIDGENQTYIDDGLQSLHFDYNLLKNNSTVFSIYNLKIPKKINYIKYFQKFRKKKKNIVNKSLLIGSSLLEKKILTKREFLKLMKLISTKNKAFDYYPHRYEVQELKELPKTFKIIKNFNPVENFLFNKKNKYKFIYSFGSSCIIEIINFYEKRNIRILDISQFINDKNTNSHIKNAFNSFYRYAKKERLKIIKLKN